MPDARIAFCAEPSARRHVLVVSFKLLHSPVLDKGEAAVLDVANEAGVGHDLVPILAAHPVVLHVHSPSAKFRFRSFREGTRSSHGGCRACRHSKLDEISA
jgi:hypothetical protein